jgi:transposase
MPWIALAYKKLTMETTLEQIAVKAVSAPARSRRSADYIHHDSGDVERSQGISRAGRGHVRGTMIQAAWLWLKHQPKSAITRWFVQRTAGQSGRIRRIMIIAVARKLAIALWRFLEQGLVPQGAMLANR